MKLASEPVWIIDDDQSIRWVLAQALKKSGIDSRTFCSADAALDSFGEERPKVIVTDIRMQGMDGLLFLDEVQKNIPGLPVIVMTAYSDLDTTVESFQRGAREHLPKPFDIDVAVTLIQRVIDEQQGNFDEATAKKIESTTMIGESAPMQEVFRAIGRLSNSEFNVLITGESGTGKELVARALFENSVRKNQPFVAINAAAIPVDLLESELFGHEKGAFTGANQRRIGRFEQADRGTLFLDEIGDMPHDLQSRLLRVMSEGKFYRVGGVNQISVDVRIIAATNQPLEELVEKHVFRSDLYHRLNVVRIALAPVRERGNDIEKLIHFFLMQAANQLNVEVKSVTQNTMECLTAFSWPGNIREIENFCRSVTIMSPSKILTPRDLPPEIEQCRYSAQNQGANAEWERSLRLAIELLLESDLKKGKGEVRQEIERIMLDTVLKFSDGSRGEAARILGWGRNTITRKIKEL